MAIKTTILLFTLLCVLAAPPAHGLIINGANILGIQLQGVLHCSLPGQPVGPGIAGVQVDITSNLTSIRARATTDANGLYTAVITNLGGLSLLNPSLQFTATVNLPIAGCSVYPLKGAIRTTDVISFVAQILQPSLIIIKLPEFFVVVSS